jgi:hypothetical protein
MPQPYDQRRPISPRLRQMPLLAFTRAINQIWRLIAYRQRRTGRSTHRRSSIFVGRVYLTNRRKVESVCENSAGSLAVGEEYAETGQFDD